MNKLLLIAAAMALSAGSAFASTARVNALQSPASVYDFTQVLVRPDQALKYGDSMVIESGTAGVPVTSGTGNAAAASGGFIRKADNSAWGLYFGNKGVSANTYRSQMGTYLGLENAMNLIYATNMGDMSVGGGLYYSKSARKPDTASAAAPKASQDAMGLYLSAETKNAWDLALTLGLGNNAKWDVGAGENKMTGKSSYKLAGGYRMSSLYYFASYVNAGAKTEDSTGATLGDRSDNVVTLGVEDTHAKDGATFVYGAKYSMTTLKDDATTPTSLSNGIAKVEKTFLSLYAGLEADVTSWMTLRGSVSQNALIATAKYSTSAAVASNIDNGDSTTVAAGAGFKFGKMEFDGTLSTATSGTFGTDGANFLASTAFTYMF